MTVTIVGIGLIGGSIAKRLKQSGMARWIVGVDNNEQHKWEALELGLVDEIKPLEEGIKKAKLVILTVPVNTAKILLPEILDHITEDAVVVDMGSTKKGICEIADQHPKRGRFVASHPIAGTENSGPKAALDHLFDNKIGIICDAHKSDKEAVAQVHKLYTEVLKMNLTSMPSEEHDLHIAYVSHLSHVSSFMLGITVLEKEKDESNIFNMAGSGFESTVRLAKSSPDMWAPIFDQNAQHLSEAIGAYIENLKVFKQLIDNKDTAQLHHLMAYANDIRRVLDGISLLDVKESQEGINNKVS